MNNELAVFGELVPVTDNKFCVDARQLHKALEVGRMFAHWIKERIEKYNFTEGVDYQKSSIISGLPILASSKRRSIPQPRIDYKLTLANDIGLEVQKCHEEKGAHWWRSYPRQAVDRVYKMLMADKSILRKHCKICRMTPKPVIQ